MTQEQTRYCPKCKYILSLDCFGKDKARSNGLSCYCLQCRRRPKIIVEVRRCSVPGCGRKHYAKDLCQKHYTNAQRAARPGHHAAQEQAYRLANPERIRRRERAYADSHRERKRAQGRARYHANPNPFKENAFIGKHRRRASGKLTAKEWRALVARSPRCYWCKRPFNKMRRPTLDHVTPITKGGKTNLENSVCACRGCNISKGNRRYNPVTGQGILL